MKDSYDVLVLGAGICGLTAAYNLSKQGLSVLVVEKEKYIGGALKTIQRPNYKIEAFYHHIFKKDKNTKKLIKELGLENRLNKYFAKTSFIYEDGIFELSSIADLLSFTKLSLKQKILLAYLLVKINLIRNYEKYDKISARRFIISHIGEKSYKLFFKELLNGKFPDASDKISAAWLIARLQMRGRRAMGESLLYLENGFGTITEALHEKIKNKVEILLNSEAEELFMNEDKIYQLKIRVKKVNLKYLISTMPMNTIFQLLSNQEHYPKLKYQGALCVIMGMKHKLTDFYWNNIQIPEKKVRAIIEHTNLVKESYDERIVYLASYPPNKDIVWKMTDTEIFNLYCEDISNYTNFKKSDVNWFKVSRFRNAGLIYLTNTFNELNALPKIENLYLGGMSVQFPERSIENSVIQANKISEDILKQEKKY